MAEFVSMARASFKKEQERRKLAAEIEQLQYKSPINHIRAALYGLIEVREKGRLKKRLLITVYIDKTNEDAALGDVGAMRQVNWLNSFLIKKSLIHEPEAEDPELLALRETFSESKVFCDRLMIEGAYVVCALLPDFKEAYAQHKPEIGPVPDRVPYEWRAEVEKLLPEVEHGARRLAAKRQRQEGESAVGYCHPPQHTRWRPGQSGNPSGKRQNSDDVWAVHRNAMMKIIGVSEGGRTRKSTRIAVAVRQLFMEAMKGTLGAHVQVKRLLISLDELGLLSPPPKSKRRSRPGPAQRAGSVAMRKRAWKILVPSVKTRMIEEYQRFHGPIPPFETRLEREFADPTPVPAPRVRIRTRTCPPTAVAPPAVHSPAVAPPLRIRTRTPIGRQSDV